MKTESRIIVVAMVVAMACVGAVSAQEAVQEPERWGCTPAGIWFGENETYGLEYVVTVEPMGGGWYSIVGEAIEETPPWMVSTAWRGMQRKTGPRTFSSVQIKYAGPSQFTDPGQGVPDIFAVRAEMTMLDCNHAEIEFGPTEAYAWGQTPFEDEPLATGTPSFATYTKIPFNTVLQTQSE